MLGKFNIENFAREKDYDYVITFNDGGKYFVIDDIVYVRERNTGKKRLATEEEIKIWQELYCELLANNAGSITNKP